MKFIFIIAALFFMTALYAQEKDKFIRQGNDLYKQQQYDKAEAEYNKALEVDRTNTTAKFNQANALYRQSKQTEAIKALDEVVMNTTDARLLSKANYNKGVIFSSQQKLEESIEAYKNALRQNPDDKEARENLQKALLELKKKTPPTPKKDEKKKKQQQQQQQMNQNEAEQRLKLLQQKERELQEKLQQKPQSGGGQQKDW